MNLIQNIGVALRDFGNEIAYRAGNLGETIRNAFKGESPLKGSHQVKGETVSVTQPQLPPVKSSGSGILNKLKAFIGMETPHYEKRDMPTDPKALKDIARDARLSNFPYTRDLTQLPEGWVPSNRLTEGLAKEMGLAMTGIEFKDGTLVDKESGLTATVLVNPKTKEVVVAFGGTTSGKKVGGDLFERSTPGRNFMTSMSQWGTNFKAGLGGVPRSYEQAGQLVAKLQQRMNESGNYDGYTLRTVGHSKGGGEAMYAALVQPEPLHCTSFCPSHLSKGLIDSLPPENVGKSKEFVQSFSPFGDPVSGLRGGVPGVQGVGVGCHFPGIEGSGMIDLHDQFLRHVEHHCGTA